MRVSSSISCCCKWHYFVFFYGWGVFLCVYIPHFLIHSWTFCFHVLAIVNSASMNILGACVFFKESFVQDICPGVELLGHMVALYLVFWGTSILSSRVVVPIYIPTNSEGGYHFLHTLSSICYLPDKTDFKMKAIRKDEEGQYWMIKWSIQEEDITIKKIEKNQ